MEKIFKEWKIMNFLNRIFGSGGKKTSSQNEQKPLRVRNLIPSDVRMGWPVEPPVRDGKALFGIDTPDGGFICLSHPTENGALQAVREIQEYIRTHSVGGDEDSILKMLREERGIAKFKAQITSSQH